MNHKDDDELGTSMMIDEPNVIKLIVKHSWRLVLIAASIKLQN